MVLYPDININVRLSSISGDHEKDRNELRQLVINEFVKERAGIGTGELASKYRYIVEELSSGDKIYLTRPARLNKGFDFVIHVESLSFPRRGDVPKHDDIFDDLLKKKRSDFENFRKLIRGLERIFYCTEPDEVLKEFKSVHFSNSYSIDLVLKITKWFFIEQDVTYWNWSGRNMFMNGIKGLID